jgi:hypothetical protein
MKIASKVFFQSFNNRQRILVTIPILADVRKTVDQRRFFFDFQAQVLLIR